MFKGGNTCVLLRRVEAGLRFRVISATSYWRERLQPSDHRQRQRKGWVREVPS